jgi:hypothetical protein
MPPHSIEAARSAERYNRIVSAALPPEVTRLFWDVDPEAVDLRRHADYVMERIMTRGTWAAMCWLRAQYGREELADFIRRRGERLAPRDRAYWALIAGVAAHQRPGGARPPWAGQ